MDTDTKGMQEVKLSKDYGEHKAGEAVMVDPARAEWLMTNGYDAERVEVATVSEVIETREIFSRSSDLLPAPRSVKIVEPQEHRRGRLMNPKTDWDKPEDKGGAA